MKAAERSRASGDGGRKGVEERVGGRWEGTLVAAARCTEVSITRHSSLPRGYLIIGACGQMLLVNSGPSLSDLLADYHSPPHLLS